MRLIDLDPKFIKRDGASSRAVEVETIDEADGVEFSCPKCAAFLSRGDLGGVHRIRCWRPSVPNDQRPGPGRWDLHGTSFDDLSLVGVSTSSVQVDGGCRAHFFVTNGTVDLLPV